MENRCWTTILAVSETAALPAQFFVSRHGSVCRGERRLVAAVLEEAIHSLLRTAAAIGNRDRKIHREAAHWIFSDDRSWPLSFVNVCDLLGIDAARLRRTLSERRDAAARSPASGRGRRSGVRRRSARRGSAR